MFCSPFLLSHLEGFRFAQKRTGGIELAPRTTPRAAKATRSLAHSLAHTLTHALTRPPGRKQSVTEKVP